MEVVEAMLSRSGMRIEDMTRGIAYFRHGFDVPLWGDYCKRRGLAGLPVVAIQCDVCRDDLLFEIELDAAVATNNGHPTFKAELRTR
jgi:hypothetical protein